MKFLNFFRKAAIFFGVFFGVFIIFHIIFCGFFPVDENNVLQAPDWYAVTGLGIALLVAVLITFRKKIRTALSASVKKSKDRKKYKNLSEVEKYRIEKSLGKNIAQNTTKTPEIQYENTIEQRSTGVQFQEKHLTYVEKELITVQRVSIKDMQQLTSLPYQWNSSIKKMTDPHAHPFAYMDLCGANINIAKSELSKINVLLANAHYLSSVLPKNLQIPVDDIVFKPSKYYGYTRLMCTPIPIPAVCQSILLRYHL